MSAQLAIDFGTPKMISDEEVETAMAAHKLRQTVKMILDDPRPEAIADPRQLNANIMALLPDLDFGDVQASHAREPDLPQGDVSTGKSDTTLSPVNRQ